MSAAAQIVRDLQARGVSLRAEHGKLQLVAPKGTVGPEVINELKARKAEVLALLAGDAVPAAENGIEEQRSATRELLNGHGVRIMRISGKFVLGIWRETDTGELRDAIATLELAHLEVRYLDDADSEIAEHYRSRPAHDITPDAKWISPQQWKARMLNKLFDELGKSRLPSRIKAETVRHGEKDKNKSDRQRIWGRHDAGREREAAGSQGRGRKLPEAQLAGREAHDSGDEWDSEEENRGNTGDEDRDEYEESYEDDQDAEPSHEDWEGFNPRGYDPESVD